MNPTTIMVKNNKNLQIQTVTWVKLAPKQQSSTRVLNNRIRNKALGIELIYINPNQNNNSHFLQIMINLKI